MVDTVIVPLDIKIDGPDMVLLKHVEWWDHFSRLALVKYERYGSMAEFGLRIDLDKRVFLDYIDNGSLDNQARFYAPLICDIVAQFRLKHPAKASAPEPISPFFSRLFGA